MKLLSCKISRAIVVLITCISGCGPSLKQQEVFNPKRVKEIKFSDECRLQSYFNGSSAQLRIESQTSISADDNKGWAGKATFVIEPELQLKTFLRLLSTYYKGIPPIPAGQPLRVTVAYLEKDGAAPGVKRQLPINAASQLQFGEEEHALPYHPCLDAFFYGRGYYKMRSRVFDPQAHAARKVAQKTPPTLIAELKDPDPALRKEAQERLVKLGPQALPDLLVAFKDPRGGLQMAISEVLSQMCARTKAMIPPLLETLKDPSMEVRFYSSWTLIRMASALNKECADPDPNIRVKAAEALAQLEVRSAIPTLLDTMQTQGKNDRRRALEALVAMGSKAAPALRRGISSPDPKIRVTALQALGKMGAAGRSALKEIRQAKGDPVAAVKKAAKAALVQIRSARTPRP